MSEPLRAACHCGAVEVELEPPTSMCSHCHCASCRRVHGAAFVTWTAVPASRFRVLAGESSLRAYASSPGVVRSFCGTCGTHLVYRSTSLPDRIYVPLATLRTAPDRTPEAHVNVAESVPWCRLPDDDLPRFPSFD